MKMTKRTLFCLLYLCVTIFLTAQFFDFWVLNWPLKNDISLWEKDIVYFYRSNEKRAGIVEVLIRDVIEVGTSEKYIVGHSKKGFFYIDLDKIRDVIIFRDIAHSSTDGNGYFDNYETALDESFKLGISEKEFQSLVQQYNIQLKSPGIIELLNIIRTYKYWFIGEVVLFVAIWLALTCFSKQKGEL